MPVNIYGTDFGLFSVIVDDNILAACRSLPQQSNTEIIDRYGSVTSSGQAFLNAIPFSSTVGCLGISSANYKATVYNRFTNLMPNWAIKYISGVTTSTTTVDYVVKDSKVVRLLYYYYNNTADLRLTMTMRNNDVGYSGINNKLPYGAFKTEALYDTTPNHIDVTFLVANNTLSDFQEVNITVYDNTRVTCSTRSPTNNTFFPAFFSGLKPIVETTDPFNPGGNTGDDDTEGTGGTGDFDGTSDNIDFPAAPALSAVDTKFISLYTPTLTELDALASYMWSSAFDLTTLKKLFADPMDCILGLSIVPVAVPSGGSRGVTVGDIATGVNMTVAGAQYIEVDCGTLNINEFWGAYLDYDPYTKAELYLPFIGIHPLAVDDIMGKAVHIKYRVDILSGACVAFVKCGDSVLYTFIGQCSSSIPITGNDWTNVINGVLTVAGSIGTMVATGGATAPMGAAAIASTAVNSFKPNVEKSGAMSGTGGMLGIKTPYMILTRPRQALPANQNEFTGYPSFITRTLDSLEGYTEIESCHLENIPATGDEITELENILKSGVIF